MAESRTFSNTEPLSSQTVNAITRAELEALVEKLKVEDGDILIWKRKDLPEAFGSLTLPNGQSIPVLVAPEGVEKVRLGLLQKVVKQLEAEAEKKADEERPHGNC